MKRLAVVDSAVAGELTVVVEPGVVFDPLELVESLVVFDNADDVDDLVLVNLSSFSFHICFIQDILPFYR